ncbi:PhoX family protein [Tellurirhabdus bombi]|uniref:PhoX family protein n=1 Tax=Tellurirhabdus bombi TaxID=2907205 RepID=UPI001F443FF6|nr:PhoX family protein [Tellurirhabdus bombi]
MKKSYFNSKIATLVALVVAGCSTLDDHRPGPGATAVVLKDYSVNPSLVKALPGFEYLTINTLISSDDKLEQSPEFVFGAQPDGAGLMKNPNGEGFILIDNHEIHQSVSRVYLDKTFKPVKGEYIVDYVGGQWRLCSATLATPAEHGFGPLFLTAGESGAESMVHAIDPIGAIDKQNKNRVLPALGKASMENAVPLPKDAFVGKTVIIIGEDDSNGQLLAYVSNTVGDLNNGKLYFLRRPNQDPVETNMVQGQSYDVEFVEVTNPKASTGAQIAAQSVEKKAIQFARVEDIDYRKGGGANSREFYFTATGVSQADKITPVTGKTMWGRVYRVVLDANDPLKGKLSVVADGSVSPGDNIVNPDNLCVTENFVYIQEDGDSYYLENKHDGRIWQYSMATQEVKPMMEMNHRRNDPAFNAKYNPSNNQQLSSWEYGAMYDVSDLTGIPNTFLVNLHPHTWQDAKYANPDGSGLSTNREGGQVVIVRGVQK